ncbi:sugar-binding domain-containing protein [Vacuolonema iberomarrocanum]|uniref:sugar-binding domain-containing protein n=1 Tax=Vacuolonema iberomarrocanum TaxID=3454632 RepID=UPI003F6E24AC
MPPFPYKRVITLGELYGQAGGHEVVIHLCDRIGAAAYPVPTPVVANSIEERKLLQTQRSFIEVQSLARQARVIFVGIGEITWKGPLHECGFINDQEITELMELGAIRQSRRWHRVPSGRAAEGGYQSAISRVSPGAAGHASDDWRGWWRT